MTPLRQVIALLALRWSMLRTTSSKAAAVGCVVAVLWLLTLAIRSSSLADPALLRTVVEVAPGVYLGFVVLALIAPVTAGGGHEIVPHDQLVVYPVRPATQFLGGLVLAPANLVWAANLLVLASITSLLTFRGGVLLAWTTTLAFVVAATLCGQAVAWLVVGARQSRRGRRIVAATAACFALSFPFALQAGWGDVLLNAGPGYRVVLAVIAGGGMQVDEWLPTTAALVLTGAIAGLLGARACAWASRRPNDQRTTAHARSVRRRADHRGVLRTLLAVDRASAWRAPALRRGGLVILLLPGLVAATLEVPWESLVVMPGLVAAGAGLLFGINAFALDGSGSLWLASLPASPRLFLLSKMFVLAEIVLGSVAVAAIAGALRTQQSPSAAQVAAMVGAGLACSAVVVAICVRSSTRRPCRADLMGPRDAIAPPGALAASSARLAIPCALVAMLIAASANARDAWFPLLLATPFVLLSALSLIRSVRYYEDPVLRAGIVHAVASG